MPIYYFEEDESYPVFHKSDRENKYTVGIEMTEEEFLDYCEIQDKYEKWRVELCRRTT